MRGTGATLALQGIRPQAETGRKESAYKRDGDAKTVLKEQLDAVMN